MENVIEINNLTKSYGKARGVIDINLKVQEGDVFGFMGPNGAGKSTTIRTLLGLIKPTKGEIKLFGKDISKDKVEILKRVGYMPSEAMFYPNMKVEEIIKFASNMHKLDTSKETDILCERLQVDRNKKISDLSLGNRKKISIICAMQHRPDLYIFDEPTSGLDPLMQKEFFNLILERNKEGATIFLSSHVLSEIQEYCKNVAIIKEGRLILEDTVEELSKSNVRKVKVKGINEINSVYRISNMEVSEDGINFIYKGEIDKLLNVLSKKSIKDLIIEEPSLEDIFMHFYSKEDK